MRHAVKIRARALKKEVLAVYLAAQDPRTPWYAKGSILLVLAYALSHIDLIPCGIWLAVRMIPAGVQAEARNAAAARDPDQSVGRFGTLIIILLWLFALILAIYFFLYFTKRI